MDQQANIKVNRRCDNDLASLLPVLNQAGNIKKIAIEACEGAADLGEALTQAGPWAVELAHPLYVSKLKGSPDKTDCTDAELLADLSRVGYLPRTWLPPKAIRQLRQLVNHRHRLADDRRALKLRIGAVLRHERIKIKGTRWTKAWLEAIRIHPDLSETARWLIEDHLDELQSVQHRLRRIEAKLREVTQGDPVIEHLHAIEGIGEITAWVLRASIGRFDRFKSAKHLCRYCGLSPKNSSSGQRQNQGGLVNAVDPRLRAILIQAAQRLIRLEPRWKQLAQRLLRQGKPKNVVVAAIANRWMRTVYQRMKGVQAA